jgi:hypothetical protein
VGSLYRDAGTLVRLTDILCLLVHCTAEDASLPWDSHHQHTPKSIHEQASHKPNLQSIPQNSCLVVVFRTDRVMNNRLRKCSRPQDWETWWLQTTHDPGLQLAQGQRTEWTLQGQLVRPEYGPH